MDRIRIDRDFRFCKEEVMANLIGSSPKFQALLEEINLVAPVDSAVLVRGETGTGKEVVAQAIHSASPRHQQPFVAINCAAIPAALLESDCSGMSAVPSQEPSHRAQDAFRPLIAAPCFWTKS